MRLHNRLAVGLFTALLTLSSCSFSPTAQKGYERIKEDIKLSMRVPSSYKGEKVVCYFDVRTITYSYQYKVTFSGESVLGARHSATVYYGYCDGNDEVISYGADSSKFVTASGRGEEKSVNP